MSYFNRDQQQRLSDEDLIRTGATLARLREENHIESSKEAVNAWYRDHDPGRLEKCYNEIPHGENLAAHPDMFVDYLEAILFSFTQISHQVEVYRLGQYIDHIEIRRADSLYCSYVLNTHYRIDTDVIGSSDLALEEIATQCCIDLENLKAYRNYSSTSIFGKLSRDSEVDYYKTLPKHDTFKQHSFYSGTKGTGTSYVFKHKAFKFYRDKEHKIQVGYMKLNFGEDPKSAIGRALESEDALELSKQIVTDYFDNVETACTKVYDFFGYRYQINPLDCRDKIIYLNRV